MKNNLKLLSIILILALVVSVVSCASADNLGNHMSPAPSYNGGVYDESTGMDGMVGNFSGEDYTEIIENQFINAAETPDSYFSIDANTASYPNLRRFIQQGYVNIPNDAVRVEEMLNYFDYDYETPKDGSVLALNSSLFDTPYNEKTKLLTIGLAAEEIEFENIKNNLVFLIDVSGSMYSEDKLPLVQQSFSLLVENLNPEDRVSIVVYAGDDAVLLEGAYGYEKQKILAVIEDLKAGGSTAGSAGISTAYNLASQYFIKGGNNRVILATDGDFNVGVTGLLDLEDFIKLKAAITGVTFSVFGFGTGNIKADKMETLALNGNGTYGYIDSINEAKRVLVEQIGGTLVTVAKDVKAGITFNPEYIESYRLVGYENKLLTEDEFENSETDAGELGSGHTVTVVYEVVLTDKALVEGESFADVKVKYKPTENAGGDSKTEQEITLSIGTDKYHREMTTTDAFVASVVEFALILRDSEYKGDANLKELIARLDSLDLSSDECKEEFKNIVKQYYEKRGDIPLDTSKGIDIDKCHIYQTYMENDIRYWDISPINDKTVEIELGEYNMPVYRCDTFEEYVHIQELMGCVNYSTEVYNEEFFKEYTLLYGFFGTSDGYTFAFDSATCQNGALLVKVVQTSPAGEVHIDLAADWNVTIAVSKKDIQNITSIAIILGDIQ